MNSKALGFKSLSIRVACVTAVMVATGFLLLGLTGCGPSNEERIEQAISQPLEAIKSKDEATLASLLSDDAKQQISDAEQELPDAEQELADGEQKLADAEQEYQDGEEELAKLENPDIFVLDRSSNVGYACFESDSDIVRGVSQVFPLFFFPTLFPALFPSSKQAGRFFYRICLNLSGAHHAWFPVCLCITCFPILYGRSPLFCPIPVLRCFHVFSFRIFLISFEFPNRFRLSLSARVIHLYFLLRKPENIFHSIIFFSGFLI